MFLIPFCDESVPYLPNPMARAGAFFRLSECRFWSAKAFCTSPHSSLLVMTRELQYSMSCVHTVSPYANTYPPTSSERRACETNVADAPSQNPSGSVVIDTTILSFCFLVFPCFLVGITNFPSLSFLGIRGKPTRSGCVSGGRWWSLLCQIRPPLPPFP